MLQLGTYLSLSEAATIRTQKVSIRWGNDGIVLGQKLFLEAVLEGMDEEWW